MSPAPILTVQDELELRRMYLFRPCDTQQELHDWVLTFIGIDFPDCTVDADSNSNPMDMIWRCYSKMRAGDDEEFRRVLFYACRDGFKTLGAAIIEVMAILHLNRNVAHMAAIQDQALKAQEYVKRAFRRPYIRDFVEGDNERITKIVRFYNPKTQHSLTKAEYEALSYGEQAKHEEVARALLSYIEKEQYVKIVICTMAGANSEHVPLFVIDELDVVSNPAAYEEAQNIPSGRDGKLPLTILTSTRKTAHGLVTKELTNKQKTGLLDFHWNLIDITRRCEPERHRPELPRLKLYRSDDELRHVDEQTYNEMNFKQKEKFVEDEGFAGCGRCKLFAVCKTRLATHQTSTSPMLKPIPETIGKFADNSIEMAQAQLMCWKPSSTGLIYGRFDRTRHILSPAQVYERVFGQPHPDPRNFTKAQLMEVMKHREVDWYGGIDWGSTHQFVHLNAFRDGARMYVTHCVSIAELDPDQMLEVSEPFKQFDPTIFADSADPKMVKLYRKRRADGLGGFRMGKLDKGKGSVVGGINVVRLKFNPPMGGEPELFFIHDIDDDPGMDLLVTGVSEYHWLNDAAGKPTDVPDKTKDDECDGLRYMVSSVFEPKGKVSTSSDHNYVAGVTDIPAVQPGGIYDPHNWMRQIISEQTGYSPPPPLDRPKMNIQNPNGSDAYTSYYADEPLNGPKRKSQKSDAGFDDAGGRRGRRGKLSWDI